MQVTTKSVLIDTTNTVNGMLEQGGVSGRRMAYPLAAVQRVTGMTAEQLKAARERDDCPGYVYVSIREVIEQRVRGRVVRRGHRIL